MFFILTTNEPEEETIGFRPEHIVLAHSSYGSSSGEGFTNIVLTNGFRLEIRGTLGTLVAHEWAYWCAGEYTGRLIDVKIADYELVNESDPYQVYACEYGPNVCRIHPVKDSAVNTPA